MGLTLGLTWLTAIAALAAFRLPPDLAAAGRGLDEAFANALPILSVDGARALAESLAVIGWGGLVALGAQGACLASGSRIAGWMTGRGVPADRVAGWLLGAGALGLGLTGLGLVGLFDRITLAMISLLLLGPAGGWRALRAFRLPASEERGVGRLAGWLARLALGLVAVTLACPETGIDSLIYHLAIPGRVVELHRLAAMPSNFLHTVPALTELLRGWTLALGGEVAARLWAVAALAAGAAALAEVVRPVGERSAPYGVGWDRIAAALWLTSPWLAELARAGKPDLWIAPLALAAFGACAGRGRRAALVAGTLAGVAAGIKPASVPVFAVLLPALAMARGFRWSELGCGLAGAAGAVAAWAVRAWLLTGNPVYPFGGTPGGAGGRFGMTSDAVAAMLEYSRHVAVRGHYATWLERLASPWTATFTDGLPALWLAAAPLAVLATGPGHPARRLILAGGLGWAVWLAGPPQLRYAMPALAWLAAAAALGLAGVAARLPRLARWLAGALLVLQTGGALVDAAASGSLVAGTGLEERRSYVARTLGVYGELTARLAETLPRRAAVLYVGESRTFPAHWRTLAASVYEPFPLLAAIRASVTAEDLHRRVRQSGVTHVVHNPVGALFTRELQTIAGWTARDLGVWAEYWRRYVRLQSLPDRLDLRAGGYYVYRIAAAREAPLPTPTLPGVEGIFAAVEGRLRRGELQAVAEQAAVLEQVAGDFAEVKYFLGQVIYAQDPYQAAEYLKQADAEEYRDLELWSALARRAEDQWRLDEALTWHQRIREFEPRAVGPAYRRVLGKLIGGARKRRRPEDAERYLRMALEISPSEAALWAELTEMLLWQGRRAEAIEAIEQAIRLNPRHAGYRGTWGHLRRAS